MKSLEQIKNFPLLMYVDISNNEITDLDALHYLPTLVQLNARYDVSISLTKLYIFLILFRCIIVGIISLVNA
jgi:Leucine-rich repeat (LRR) protein